MESLFHKIPAKDNDEVHVLVEIPKGSRNKYEYDKDSGAIFLDRVLHSPFFYPVDYGFVPQTWYDDDDPLDAMIHIREPSFPGCIIKCQPVGLLRMKDEKGTDDKLLCIPKDDPAFEEVDDIKDLPKAFLEEVAHFFQRYKDLEKGKHSDVVGWFGAKDGIKAVEHGMELYKKKFGAKK